MVHSHYQSPIGSIQLFASDGVLESVKLEQHGGGSDPQPDGSRQPFIRQLNRYFNGKTMERDLLQWVEQGTTEFAGQVFARLLDTSFGETLSYGELADDMGRPKSGRAVGQALASNDIPIFLPCHRIVRSDGFVGGFTGGLRWKTALLRHEGHQINSNGLMNPAS